jgi:DNA replication and repair protein RecF
MIINKISFLNYKNILQADMVCSSKVNCFFGNNGMGKTNLLDAIYYLSFCKSHIHTPENQIISHNEDFCVLQGAYFYDDRQEDIYCVIRRGQRKQFKRNQKVYDRLSDHIGLIPLVMVSPADAELIRGGGEERRRFMDVIISQYDKPYLQALINYNKILMQRNQLLRDHSQDTTLYEVLEIQMETLGKLIFEGRCRLIQSLTPYFNTYYRQICRSTETVNLSYISQLYDDQFEKQLAANRERETIVGYTLTGIHRDDLEMTLNDYPIRQTGSQGQNKTYLIALKLAQYAFLAAKGNTKPILLLDDIFDKLDAERVEQIVALVSGEQFGQIFMTDTNRKYLDRILTAIHQDYTLYKVEKGEVFLMEERKV